MKLVATSLAVMLSMSTSVYALGIDSSEDLGFRNNNINTEVSDAEIERLSSILIELTNRETDLKAQLDALTADYADNDLIKKADRIHYLEGYLAYYKNLATNKGTPVGRIGFTGEMYDASKRKATTYSTGVEAIGATGDIRPYAELRTIKENKGYDYSLMVAANDKGAHAEVVTTVDIVENKRFGLSVIAGAAVTDKGIEPMLGLEAVGRRSGIAVTPIDIKLVERTGENDEFRRRYTLNPFGILIGEMMQQRTALDVMEDNKKRREEEDKIAAAMIGTMQSREAVEAVEAKTLKPWFWMAKKTGLPLYNNIAYEVSVQVAEQVQEVQPEPTAQVEVTEVETIKPIKAEKVKGLFRIQIGAYKVESNADTAVSKVKEFGEVVIKKGNGKTFVSVMTDDEGALKKIKDIGFSDAYFDK